MISFRSPAADQRRVSAAHRPIITGAFIALAVLGLHLLVGLGIVLSPPLRCPGDANRPLVLLTELPPPAESASTSPIFVAINVSVAPPRPIMPALPAAPDDAVIVDAAPADDSQVARVCGGWSIQRERRGGAEQEPNVLVRVDADGRVSDSRLLVGTGSADRDAALQHCLLHLARLTPILLEGHAVAAWQRLHATREESAHRR